MNYFRVDINDSVLEEAVQRAVADFVKNDRSFTAYELTKLLRLDIGNGFNVEHEKVRLFVHDIMDGLVDAGFYHRDEAFPVAGTFATQYSPSDIWLSSSANVKNNVPAAPSLKVVIPNLRVDSTLVRGIAYNGNDIQGDVTIKMDTGIYVYKDVPFATYIVLINSTSKGRSFNELLRGKFQSEKI